MEGEKLETKTVLAALAIGIVIWVAMGSPPSLSAGGAYPCRRINRTNDRASLAKGRASGSRLEIGQGASRLAISPVYLVIVRALIVFAENSVCFAHVNVILVG